MCNFHSSIVAFIDNEVKIYHTDESSHHIIADRAGLTDEMYESRLWLRVECTPQSRFKFVLDEVGEMPDWYVANAKDIKRRVRSLARSAYKIDKQVAPLWAEYDKQVASLRAEYNKQVAPLRAEYDKQVASLRAEYDKQVASLWAEYNNQVAPLRAEYDKQVASLRAEYNKQVAPLRAEYDKQVASLRAEYNKQVAPLWARMKEFESYVGK
jgi:phage host-nuclease inhibitor protein Gam